jgi:c-di-GMP-binding flagellar brake protein YcgR
MEWAGEAEKTESINGDRRRDRRYGIHLDLRWKLIRRRRVLETGVGQTVDLSSGGILFVSGHTLPVGLNVELAITWPVLLRNEAPMQLIVAGRIVRTSPNGTAVEMVQHEFRTMSIANEQRGRQGSTTPPSSSMFMSSGSGGAGFGKYR